MVRRELFCVDIITMFGFTRMPAPHDVKFYVPGVQSSTRKPKIVKPAIHRVYTFLSRVYIQSSYSKICGFVRSRLSIALVRSSSRCLRGDRNPTQRFQAPIWDSGTGLGLYRMSFYFHTSQPTIGVPNSTFTTHPYTNHSLKNHFLHIFPTMLLAYMNKFT